MDHLHLHPCPHPQESSWSTTVEECLVPPAKSPGFLGDKERHVATRSSQWASMSSVGEVPGQPGSPVQQGNREQEMARRHAKEALRNQHATSLEERKIKDDVKEKSIEESRVRTHQRDSQRSSDLQLVVESRLVRLVNG